MNMRLHACGMLFVFLLFGVVNFASAGSAADMWSKFDRSMATFNPIGKHVRQPIERAVPNLRFKGFLRQWTDVLIDEDGNAGFRNQDYRFLQLQNLLELEMAYHIAPGLDVNVTSHFMYDGAYDWQGSNGLFADSIDRTAELYHDRERILREAYISYRTPNFDLKIGKQQITWGKMDGQFIDVINGMDRRESVQLETEDFEWRRLPTWMASSTFYFGRNSLQLLYILDFEQDRQAIAGSPWASPLVPPPSAISDIVFKPRRPQFRDFSDHEYGIRFDRAQGALTYGFIYFYGWDKNPVEHVVGRETRGTETLLHLQPKHERLHHFGMTADYATTFNNVPWVNSLPTVFRVEALYTNGVRFADFDKRAAARSGLDLDGTSKRDTLRAALAAEVGLPGRSTFILQGSLYYTFDWKRNLGPGFGGGIGDQWTVIPVAFFSRPFGFTRDRLSMEVTLFPVVSGPDAKWQGIKSKFRFKYKFSQFVSGQLIYNGYDSGSDTDLYGQYEDWDNIGWELSYEF
jgi:hypothetical protein